MQALTTKPKYRAFISYSHRDAAWGDWLHKSLERYRVPRALVGRETGMGPVPGRLFPIFRDREELPTTSDLSQAIDDALRDSLFLIVMCSPAAAASRWVNEEIRAFKHLHGEDRILAIVVDGEPNATDRGAPEMECFPEALRHKIGPGGTLSAERTEPIAADARPQGDGRDDALLKLLAGLLAVNFNDLKQREVQAARRRARVAQAIAAAMAVLALAALGAGWVAYQNQQIAEEQRIEAVKQRRIAEAQTRRADAERDVANAQRRIAEARLREAMIERAGRALSDGRAAAIAGEPHRALALALSALETGTGLADPALTSRAAALGRGLLMDDRLEACLEGRYPVDDWSPPVRAMRASPDGALIMAMRGEHLLIWRRMTGARLQRISGVMAATFGTSGGPIALLRDGRVAVVDAETGQASVVSVLSREDGTALTVRRASLSHDGSQAAVISGAALYVADLASGKIQSVLAVDARNGAPPVWSRDGRHLAMTERATPRARVWRVDDGAVRVDIAPASPARTIRFGNGATALLGTDTGWFRLDPEGGDISPIDGQGRVDDAIAAANGHIVVERTFGPAEVIAANGTTRALGSDVTFGLVGLRADGREVLIRDARGFALHDVETGSLLRRIGRAGGAPAGFHLSVDGGYLAIIDEDGLTTVWSLADGRETLAYRAPGNVSRIAVLDAPLGALLMIVDMNGRISLHRAEAAHLVGSISEMIGTPLPGGLVPVTHGYPDPARLWDITTRHPVRDLPGPVLAQDAETGRLLTRLGGALAVSAVTDARPVQLSATVPRLVGAHFGSGGLVALQTPDEVILLDTASGAIRGRWAVAVDQSRWHLSAGFSPSGARLLYLTGDGHLLDIDTESATVLRRTRLASGAALIGFAADGDIAVLGGPDTVAGWRYELATGTLSAMAPSGKILATGARVAVLGDGRELSSVDLVTGHSRPLRAPPLHAPAIGADGTVLLGHLSGDPVSDTPDQFVAIGLETGEELWRIDGRRPFGASFRPPTISSDGNWALVAQMGPQAAHIVELRSGQVAGHLPSPRQSTFTLLGDPGLDTVAMTEGVTSRVLSLSSAKLSPDALLGRLAAYVPETDPDGKEGISPGSNRVTPCDIAAAHPDDPAANTDGRAIEDLPLDAASLCLEAARVAAGRGAPESEISRLQFQLARAYDAQGQSTAAIAMLEDLSARGYAMADYSLGIWHLAGLGTQTGPEQGAAAADAAAAAFRQAADGGVGVAWVILSRLADAGLIDADPVAILREGADRNAPDALHALALRATGEGNLATAHKLAHRAATAAQPHRRWKFTALAQTLARRIAPDEHLSPRIGERE